jgi:hypothetical protein
MGNREETTIGRRALTAASLGLLLFGLGGCTDQYITRGVGGRNETATKLHFVVRVGGKEYQLAPKLEPGASTLLVSGSAFGPSSFIADERCTKGDLVALAEDGREFARHPPPLCIGDVWTITTP